MLINPTESIPFDTPMRYSTHRSDVGAVTQIVYTGHYLDRVHIHNTINMHTYR